MYQGVSHVHVRPRPARPCPVALTHRLHSNGCCSHAFMMLSTQPLRIRRLYAEEHLQPEKKPQEPVASPQHDTQKVQQRPAPGKRAPATAQQPSAARYLTSQYGQRNGRAHDGGRSFPQHEMQPMHNHNHSLHMQEEEQWHIDPEMVRLPFASLYVPGQCASARTRPMYPMRLQL